MSLSVQSENVGYYILMKSRNCVGIWTSEALRNCLERIPGWSRNEPVAHPRFLMCQSVWRVFPYFEWLWLDMKLGLISSSSDVWVQSDFTADLTLEPSSYIRGLWGRNCIAPYLWGFFTLYDIHIQQQPHHPQTLSYQFLESASTVDHISYDDIRMLCSSQKLSWWIIIIIIIIEILIERSSNEGSVNIYKINEWISMIYMDHTKKRASKIWQDPEVILVNTLYETV
jgi:hypothetical protein